MYNLTITLTLALTYPQPIAYSACDRLRRTSYMNCNYAAGAVFLQTDG